MTAQWWLVFILSSLVNVYLVYSDVFARVDNIAYDYAQQLPRTRTDKRVVLVIFDNRSIKEFGKWPWPRSVHADLINILSRTKPLGIGYDVLFTEPSDDTNDKKLAQSLAASSHVYLPLLLDVPGSNGRSFNVVYPIALFLKNAAGVGHVSLTVDSDGVARRVFLLMEHGDSRWLHLTSLLASRSLTDGAKRYNSQEDASGSLVAANPIMIPFIGRAGSFPTISAASVLRGEVPPDFFHDRFVLVGGTAGGLGDQYPTPRGLMSGVEIQANILNAVLTSQAIRPAPTWAHLLLSLLPLWILLLSYRLAAPGRIALILSLCMASVFIATTLSWFFGLWLPPSIAIFSLLVAYPVWSWRQLAAVSRYMGQELQNLALESDMFPRPPHVAARDPMRHQIALLKETGDQVREMRRFISDRLHQMPDAVIVTDTSGTMLLRNAQADNLLDQLAIRKDARGAVSDLLGVLSDLKYKDGRQFQFLDDIEEENFELNAKSKSGNYYNVRIAPQRSERLLLIGWTVIISDVSGAKTLELQRERMVHLLSHDIRSPQTSILAVLDKAGPEDVGEMLKERIKAYADRTLHLADGFVQLARAEYFEYTFRDVDFSAVVSDAMDSLWPQYNRKEIDIVTAQDNDAYMISGDPSLLNRVVINILENAIKYSPANSKIILELSNVNQESAVLLKISDFGKGILPEDIGSLFEPFYRGTDTEDALTGAGLGLAFARTVIVRHGGTISCKSKFGYGTTFEVTIPLQNHIT